MKKILKVVANVLAWAVLIVAFLITVLVFTSTRNNGIANIFGYMALTVESDSMSPTFKKDDMIICKEIDDVNKLNKGDVITFWTIIEGKRVKNTHRIVGINGDGNSKSFVTRGDHNSADDDLPAYQSDLIGKWTGARLMGAGKVMNFLKTKTGFFVCILIPMAIFFLFELYKFIFTIIEIKREDNGESNLDEEEIKRRAIEEYLQAQQGGSNAPAQQANQTQPVNPAPQAETNPAPQAESNPASQAESNPAPQAESNPAPQAETAEDSNPV